jgi:hypothetical protein
MECIPNNANKCKICDIGFSLENTQDKCSECNISNCSICSFDSITNAKKCDKCNLNYNL